ncbi:MAG: ImmA/IrrE family metallo-endopeptidase [Boseongicola sp. SB0662_bin_57]|nr:ImmA/IrrE family metallo-endopeptidase [Boseongicola sp. SB0662_bin_57]
MTRVPVNPALLRWARKRARVAQEDLAVKFKKLPEWERGETKPTLRQLEAFARAVHVPFGYLFLDEPPNESLPIADFRTVADTANFEASPNLIDTLYAMQRRQAWLREHLIENGAEPLAFAASARLDDDPGAVGREIRRALGLDGGWAAGVRSWQDAVNELRRMIEQVGVMAVINGVVGNDTHRRLSVAEFRGFALTDLYAPLIFVNGADAKSAQMFTLAHELAHIWLGEEGLSGFESLLPGGTEVEDWCNQAAAELLVPSRELRECWMQARRAEDPFGALARSFKVSSVVAARRAMDLRLIERSAFFEFYERYTDWEHKGGATSSGGDFYNSQNARVGKLFATHVIGAAMGGEIGFREAYELTGLRGRTFQDYAGRLGIMLS